MPFACIKTRTKSAHTVFEPTFNWESYEHDSAMASPVERSPSKILKNLRRCASAGAKSSVSAARAIRGRIRATPDGARQHAHRVYRRPRLLPDQADRHSRHAPVKGQPPFLARRLAQVKSRWRRTSPISQALRFKRRRCRASPRLIKKYKGSLIMLAND